MLDDKETKEPRISLEQLLRVKRSERPTPDFWDHFDRELHQKQLSALVHGRPWFVRFGGWVGLWARRLAPITAAATAVAAGYFAISGPAVVVNGPDKSPVSDRFETIAVRPVETPVVALVGKPRETVVAPVATRSDRVEARPQPVAAEARYVVDIMVTDDQPQRYVTLSAPKTLLANSSPSGIYVVNALSSQTSFGRPSSRAVAHF
jgi:hypothetical protein